MSLLRCPRAFVRPLCSGARVTGRSLGYPALRNALQTRDQHNRSTRDQRNRPTRDQRKMPEPGEILETIDPSKDATLTVDKKGNMVLEEKDEHGNTTNIRYYTKEQGAGGGPKVQILRPALATIALSFFVLSACSYFKAKEELKPVKRSFWPQMQSRFKEAPTPLEMAEQTWKQLDPVSKLGGAIIGACTSIHLVGVVLPTQWLYLWHTPASNQISTLFTSALVHAGPMHLGFNMWACYQFLPPVGYSRLFRGDTTHLMSFMFSAAAVTGWSQHVASSVFQRGIGRDIRGGGFSGVLFAILGAFCVEYPTHKLGIMFLPFSFEAQYFFPAVMLFDFIGMVRGYSFVNFGHGVCLTLHRYFGKH